MKEIKGYEGLYAITSCGKVWSYRKNKFLNPQDAGKGYLQVKLYKDGTGKCFYLYRLVAQTYLPNPENLPEVNHKDECKSHNYLQNLEWCSRTYNTHYGTGNDRRIEKRKRAVYCLELNQAFDSIKEAAQSIGIAPSYINKCLRGRQRLAGDYHWRYVE